MVNISSWGRLTNHKHDVKILSNQNPIEQQLGNNLPGIAHGMGRSYGDVCLNPGGLLWKTIGLDRFISFNQQTGLLVCEAGLLLRDIQQLMIPRNWTLPVTPGTQLITVGGAIANDVHGKNHHVAGNFGNHVQSIQLARTDGTIIECGPNIKPEWFSATIGGMGLTGVITKAAIQLKRIAGPWLNTETVPFSDLGDFFQLADASESEWEHTVAWIDCLSKKTCRGIFMRANPTDICKDPEPQHRKLSMPVMPPISLINKVSLRTLNTLYFHLKKRQTGPHTMHYEPFFYPLDNVHKWNRIYGPNGFFQYQSVVPREVGHHAVQAMLDEIARSGDGSFLAVLKTFGNMPSSGLLSFPQPGVTLALDFPNKNNHTLRLLDKLDNIVKEAGGRIYPAKDARMPRSLFEAGYPNLGQFLHYRDPGISSAMSRRLLGS